MPSPEGLSSTGSGSDLVERNDFCDQWLHDPLGQEETEEEGAEGMTLGVDPVGDAGLGRHRQQGRAGGTRLRLLLPFGQATLRCGSAWPDSRTLTPPERISPRSGDPHRQAEITCRRRCSLPVAGI